MIQKVEMYTIVCDHCSHDNGIDGEHSCWNDDSYAWQIAEEEGWIEVKENDVIKHYCGGCWDYDWNDQVVLDPDRKDKYKLPNKKKLDGSKKAN